MKPAPFQYHKPKTLAVALLLLEQTGDDGKILAGGQSLVPIMALRLARPKVLIDINGLAELAYVREDGGWLAIGAATRQRALERSGFLAKSSPLLSESLPLIGHIQTRNRGTIGGSLAHADPAAELPAIALALDAEIIVASIKGSRAVSAREFFLGPYTTALQPNEILSEIRLPYWPEHSGWAVFEFNPHHGSFAVAGAAVRLATDAGKASDVRIALFGVDQTARRAEMAENNLRGVRVNERTIGAAAKQAAAEIDPDDDVAASAAYRRHLVQVLVERALRQACDRAERSTHD